MKKLIYLSVLSLFTSCVYNKESVSPTVQKEIYVNNSLPSKEEIYNRCIVEADIELKVAENWLVNAMKNNPENEDLVRRLKCVRSAYDTTYNNNNFSESIMLNNGASHFIEPEVLPSKNYAGDSLLDDHILQEARRVNEDSMRLIENIKKSFK